jgi:hypothetical protein
MRSSSKSFFSLSVFFLITTFTFAAPTVSVTPKTQSVQSGHNIQVKITTQGAKSCTVSGGRYSGNKTILNGSVLLTPTTNTTFTFVCADA